MTSRTLSIAAAMLAVLALSACSIGVNAESTDTGGTIEMAVSETCVEGAAAECVSAGGSYVLLPSVFEQADVEESRLADNGQNAVELKLDDNGAEVLHTLTAAAVEAGDSARLVLKIGGELQAAAMVMEALEGGQLQIAVSERDDAQELLDLIRSS